MKHEISTYETLLLIDKIKTYFEKQLEKRLDLIKVPSPLFVRKDTGLQDQLSGVEVPVSFDIKNERFEVVQSLAKWKRMALYKYKFDMHKGLYTDMKAIRPCEDIDIIHSLYVEQWDWEKIISKEDRTIEYLKSIVTSIYKAIRQTSIYIAKLDSSLALKLSKTIKFFTSQELENMYPNLTTKEIEYKITKKYGSVFVIGIGDKLKSGKIYDLRSPDYDDWKLNGDLLIFDDVIDRAIEITSMGIRVDEASIIEQLEKSDCLDRKKLPYHKMIIENVLPYTIGGGIGISRLLMLLLKKKCIGEIQTSSWPKDFEYKYKEIL